jgi:hypothetical protein
MCSVRSVLSRKVRGVAVHRGVPQHLPHLPPRHVHQHFWGILVPSVPRVYILAARSNYMRVMRSGREALVRKAALGQMACSGLGRYKQDPQGLKRKQAPLCIVCRYPSIRPGSWKWSNRGAEVHIWQLWGFHHAANRQCAVSLHAVHDDALYCSHQGPNHQRVWRQLLARTRSQQGRCLLR